MNTVFRHQTWNSLRCVLISLALAISCRVVLAATPPPRPNILIAISDDQSFPHTSIAGCTFVKTPAFDRIAGSGVLFTNAIAPSPGCGPSRASIALGRYPWQNEHAGNHHSLWPKKFTPFNDILGKHGYFVGYTGKGVTPSEHALGGRETNAAGPEFNEFRIEPHTNRFLDPIDYARNFEAFLAEKPAGAPFCFQLLSKEPHRSFQPGSGLKAGKKLADVQVPTFLPDTDEVRRDLLDYAHEIEWFDTHLARCLALLEERGELANTIVIVTSDNGMAFPAAKALCYEYGIHVPLAIAWPAQTEGGRKVDDPVSLIDLYPTLFEILRIPLPERHPVSGTSLAGYLIADAKKPPARDAVFSSRERHSSARWMNLGYPQRAIRTRDFLYVWNFHPERWPAGSPHRLDNNGKLVRGFYDVDDVSPNTQSTAAFLLENTEAFPTAYQLAFGKRPQEELFDIRSDPGCLHNLAKEPSHETLRADLNRRLFQYLRETGDPRVVGPDPEIFESYRRYGEIRNFPKPEWATDEEKARWMERFAEWEKAPEPIAVPDDFGKSHLRLGRYLLTFDDKGKASLFDIETDPDRTRDLSRQKPRATRSLQKLHSHIHPSPQR
jgi:N-sulfoglucosamine sulfohydrolase